MERAAAALAAELTELDVLVHAAGDYAEGTVAAGALADLDRAWRVNLRAPWVLTRALLPALVRREGWVVFVNSSVWGAARGGLGGYAASKYGLKAMADALRAEVNGEGVRVLSVFPGGRRAGCRRRSTGARAGRIGRRLLMQPADVAQAVLGALALPRTAEMTDLYIRPARKGS